MSWQVHLSYTQLEITENQQGHAYTTGNTYDIARISSMPII